MLKAIIFDFNGVILDDEPLHFQSMRDSVAGLGIHITKEEYWTQYLPLDDRSCLEAICRNYSRILEDEDRRRLLELKALNYRSLLRDRKPLFPGAAEFIRAAAARYPLALASGARRDEIESTLREAGLHHCFSAIAGAEDFVLGKPHPESYLFALKLLNSRRNGVTLQIRPDECLVIEDSVDGVQGARAAGMRCLALTNTYSGESLGAANRIVSSFHEVEVDELEQLWQEPA